jgi:hypothetical protein
MPATRLDQTLSNRNNITFQATVYTDSTQTTVKDLTGIDGAIYAAHPVTGPGNPFEFDLVGNSAGQVVVTDAANGLIEARVAKGMFTTPDKKVTNWFHSLLVIDGTDEQTQFEGYVTVTFGPAAS